MLPFHFVELRLMSHALGGADEAQEHQQEVHWQNKAYFLLPARSSPGYWNPGSFGQAPPQMAPAREK